MYLTIMALHLLGATIWTGGHLVLALTVLPRALRARDPDILLDFEQGFEKIGIPALVIQVTTGLWLAWQISPGVGTWLSPQDGLEAGISLKLGLLLATALLAMNARFRVIPNLTAETLPLMGWHIRAVTVFAVLFALTGLVLRTGGF